MSRLFDDLCTRLNTQPGRDGEAMLSPCVNCGKESKRGHVHASFSERGWHCFPCGTGGSLADLAQRMGVEGHVRAAPPPPPDRPRRPFEAGRYASYHVGAAKYEAWAKYAPSLAREVIDAYRLGVGTFPEYTSKCQHERLMVPLMVGSNRVISSLVGLRGRSTSCACGKWLSAAGTRGILYNGARLRSAEEHDDGIISVDVEHRDANGERDPGSLGNAYGNWMALGRVLWIVENPIDALLVEQKVPGAAAVAILGASCWKEEWTEAVARCGSESVIVCLDSDVPGNGNTKRAWKEWRESGHRDIEPNGIKIANRLLRAGVRRVSLFPWSEGDATKRDIGDLLRR